MISLAAMAAHARLSGNRLLHACPAQERAAKAARLNAVVTLAPLSPDGPEGPLFGVPVTVKDSYATQNLRTTASHPALIDHVPDEDAALVARLRATGAVIIGKTNLAELCGDVQTRSPIFGVTSNPWDPTRTAGGSGGGGAVAVALGFSRLDLGSDLAGSLRIPAAFCGVTALKASHGSLPLAGHMPPLDGADPPPFQCGGLIARDITDLQDGYLALTDQAPPLPHDRPLRLALRRDFGIALCPRSQTGLERAESWLHSAGHQIENTMAFDLASAWRGFGISLTAPYAHSVNLWQKIGLRFLSLVAKKQPIRVAMLAGLTGATQEEASRLQAKAAAQIDAILSQHDALLVPVTATAAFPHAPKPASYFASRRIKSGTHQLPYVEANLAFTSPFSLSGHPVVVLPIDVVDGLPIGIQIIGAKSKESELLAIAAKIEACFATHRPRPSPPTA